MVAIAGSLGCGTPVAASRDNLKTQVPLSLPLQSVVGSLLPIRAAEHCLVHHEFAIAKNRYLLHGLNLVELEVIVVVLH